MGKLMNSIATTLFAVTLVALAFTLEACGDNNSKTGTASTSTVHGTLIDSPPFRIASLTAADFAAELGTSQSGMQLLEIAGTPMCGVDFYYIQYYTVGGAGETTNASGALMVPTGGAGCSGARPVVLYAHGTTTAKNYNIANIADSTNPAYDESALIAAMYAAQGFIVVAPNYAGYDVSSLPYHPYLNGAQQSGDMMDALSAARTALPTTYASSTSDNGQLLVTGYSQGGYVALATVHALQVAGQTVTAAAPGSGPYALEAFGDAIFYGNVDIGSVVFAPLLTTSYQKAYGNIYESTSDVYTATYATGIDTLLPSDQSLDSIFASGLLPETALFDSVNFATAASSTAYLEGLGVPAPEAAELGPAMAIPANPLFASGFGSPFLINDAYRVSYVLDAAANPDGALAGSPTAGLAAAPPTQTFRNALYVNDLRNGSWAPMEPLLMCGGVQDPTVFFNNAQIMQQFWGNFPLPAGLITVFSVDPSPATTSTDPLQAGFLQAEAAINTAAGGGLAGEEAVIQSYHGTLVPPFCAAAARGFFLQILGS